MRYTVEVRFHNADIKLDGNRIVIGMTAKPIKGAANRELIRKLAKHFKVSTSNIQIVAGFKSKKKVVEIVHTAT